MQLLKREILGKDRFKNADQNNCLISFFYFLQEPLPRIAMTKRFKMKLDYSPWSSNDNGKGTNMCARTETPKSAGIWNSIRSG